MVSLTSWDANVFLCLLTYLPEDVVKGMIGYVKKTHEEFSLDEARGYWENNSPALVVVNYQSSVNRLKFYVNNDNDRGKTRIMEYHNRGEMKKEFKREWGLRSIEARQKKVVEWCKFGDDRERLRHQGRLRLLRDNSYTKNLWATWDAWSHCEHPPQIMSWDTVRPQTWDRRVYVSKWYEGIHPGRFFLFFRENKILEERNWDILPRMFEQARISRPQTPIFNKGPYEQLIEDLRCLDGGGLGEKVGKKVEHIDDLFS